MEKLLVYPFDETFKSILEYGTISKDRMIVSLVSPAGWGLIGNEYLSNDGRLLSVSADFEKEIEKTDALWIVNSQDMPNEDDEITQKINYAIAHNKNIYYTRNKSESLQYKKFNKINCIGDINDFACGCELNLEELQPINTPVLIIADLYGGTADLRLELSMRHSLIKEGYNVLNITWDKTASVVGCVPYPDKFFLGNIDTREKILMMNNYIAEQESLHHPDLIVVSIPNGLMNCSHRCLDQFGYYAFIMTKVLSIDVGVLRVPYNDYTKMEINSLVEYIKNAFMITIDFIYVSNKYLLLEDSEIYGYPRYLNLSDKFISENNKEKTNQSVFFYSEEKILTKQIIKQFNSYGQHIDIMPHHDNCESCSGDKIYSKEERLEEIFLNRTGINFAMRPELKKMHFLGSKLNIPVRELILIYTDIENIFNIAIPTDFVVENKYTTFENLLTLL